jgi:HK97 family phage major capsid protein
MPDDGTDANQVVFLGDLSNYIVAQRTQVTSVVLRERYADSDQTAIILFERLGGNCYNTDAGRFGVV